MRWRAAAAAGAGLVGADPLALAGEWAGGAASPARAALGFAALNALSRELFDRAGFVPPMALDSIGGIDPQPGESIGMVGYFPPLVQQVLARGAQLTVLELRADLAGQHPGHRVTLDPRDLAGCSQLLCTSTTLLNHSLDGLLRHCAQARRVVLIGPGAGCLPAPLFARGITALAGSWITDAAGFTQALASGAPWRRTVFKFLLQRDEQPHLAALLTRRA